jgi:hypothetical protein
MTKSDAMINVVQRQLDAYNRHDLETWLQTYAHDAQQYEFPDTLLARGQAEIRARATLRFQEPDLHAQLLRREVNAHQVIDHELVTRNFPEGLGTIEMACIYEIASGKIQKTTFVLGKKIIFDQP